MVQLASHAMQPAERATWLMATGAAASVPVRCGTACLHWGVALSEVWEQQCSCNMQDLNLMDEMIKVRKM